MSEWTKAKGDEARCETLLENDLRLCFPKWHDSQDKLDNLDRLGQLIHNKLKGNLRT